MKHYPRSDGAFCSRDRIAHAQTANKTTKTDIVITN